jgi:hypothetical protein
MRYDLPNYATSLAVLPVAAIAATANGTPFDLNPYVGKVLLRADIGNSTAGTNPTLDLVVKQSTDNSNWSNANVAFTQATAASAQVLAYDTRAQYRYMRVDRVIGGTNTPSFPVSIVGIAQREYNPS